ncbi:hypothetical protein OBA46_00490 [SAR86 cluster bacterium]|nr:hypothetical protein [SAR86 cluster bacterium]
MKKLTLLIAILFASYSFTADGPFVGLFGIKTENPAAVVAASDQLRKDCGTPEGVTTTLMAEALNGSDPTTHTYIVGFPNNAAYVEWNAQIATCPGWAKYFEAMNPVSDQTVQALAFPLAGGGDASKDTVFVNFFANVSRPDKFFPAYEDLMEVASTDGTCPGSWGLLAVGPGVDPDEYGTHIAYCGYPDLATYMDVAQIRVPSKAFQRFIRKTFRISENKGVTSSAVVKIYD